MNMHHVLLVFLCCVCVCVCDRNSTVSIVANQTTQDPGDCNVLHCRELCAQASFSEKDSRCILLFCSKDVSCNRTVAELGREAQNEGPNQTNGSDPLQPAPPSPESPVSPSITALPATPSASAAPVSPPVSPPGPDGKQHSASSTSSEPGFSSNTSRSSQGGGLGLVQKKTLPTGHQGQALNNSSENGHQGQPSVEPPTPAPTSTPAPVASVGTGNISSTAPKEQNGTDVNKSGQETTTTTTTTTSTTSVKPALPTNSTTTSTTTTTVTLTTTSDTTPNTTTTNKVISTPSTTQIPPTSTPPSTPPPSPAPPFLPSVTPSTPPPGQNPSTTTPKVPDVASDQDKAMVETAGGELVSHVVNTSSLIAVLIFGLLFFIVTVILFLRHAYESYKRRGYTQMDYLINGMYSDSGL